MMGKGGTELWYVLVTKALVARTDYFIVLVRDFYAVGFVALLFFTEETNYCR